MRRAAALLLLLAAACSTARSTRPPSIPKPSLDVALINQLFFGSGGEADATIEVTVGNRGSVPITIRRVEVSSPGMLEYELVPIAKEFHQTIAPGETKAVRVLTTARTDSSRQIEPLMLRAVLQIEGGGSTWREIVVRRY